MRAKTDPHDKEYTALRNLPGGPNVTGTSVVDPVHTFETGAQRSETKPRYDLIPNSGLVRLAARFEMGLKYGEFNYKLGLPFDDTFNHILAHLQHYKERRKAILQGLSESNQITTQQDIIATTNASATDGDDLAAAAWGCFALMELEEQGRLG